MANFSGILKCILISLTAAPAVMYVTTRPLLTEPLTMMTIGITLLLGITVIVVRLLPPSGIKAPENMEGRGALYYTSALFMWASIADLTIQSSHYGFFIGLDNNVNYFIHGEPYLETPAGITVQYWNAVVNYFLYVIIIYKIENHQDPRNAALYWCGSIITSQFQVINGALCGTYSDQLEWSVWLNAIFVIVPLWMFIRLLIKPRSDLPDQSLDKTKYHRGLFDWLLSFGLLASSLLCLLRGFAALDSKFPLIQNYVANYEPFILEPIKFGTAWAIYGAMYGVPFQIAAIYGLLTPGKEWMLNLSVFYASAMLQGSFVFTSYSWFKTSIEAYRIPEASVPTVLAINISLVAVAHLLMYRCVNRPAYFMCKSTQGKMVKKHN